MQAEEMLTVAQLAARTNTGQSTWNKRRMSGDTPPYLKLGRKVLYRWTDVEQWLASRTRRSTSDPGDQPASAAA